MHPLAIVFVVLAVIQVTFSAPVFRSDSHPCDVQACGIAEACVPNCNTTTTTWPTTTTPYPTTGHSSSAPALQPRGTSSGATPHAVDILLEEPPQNISREIDKPLIPRGKAPPQKHKKTAIPYTLSSYSDPVRFVSVQMGQSNSGSSQDTGHREAPPPSDGINSQMETPGVPKPPKRGARRQPRPPRVNPETSRSGGSTGPRRKQDLPQETSSASTMHPPPAAHAEPSPAGGDTGDLDALLQPPADPKTMLAELDRYYSPEGAPKKVG
ncbi:hypothetical protein K439DRAFT_1623617 [Ramaria rubella]|nr:hypothetical protein K439DRAFT_1623617 [Ramaria rubella]